MYLCFFVVSPAKRPHVEAKPKKLSNYSTLGHTVEIIVSNYLQFGSP